MRDRPEFHKSEHRNNEPYDKTKLISGRTKHPCLPVEHQETRINGVSSHAEYEIKTDEGIKRDTSIRNEDLFHVPR
jgi:hypothetical protein